MTPAGARAARAYDASFSALGFPARATPQWPVAQTFAGSIQLAGVSADRTSLAPGLRLGVTMFWKAERPARGRWWYFVQVLNDAGEARVSALVLPAHGAYDTDEWRPGRYWLSIGLFDPLTGQKVPVTDAAGRPAGDAARVGPLKVPLDDATPAAGETPLAAHLGEALDLAGYRVDLREGRMVVRLRWQAVARPEQDYTVFIHLEGAGGGIVAQSDEQPRAGAYPTSLWDAGETVVTEQALELPADLPAGPYKLWVGMYWWPTGERLPVRVEGRSAPEDRLLLETISVPR
jgi:hypothetical protein